MKKQHLYLAIVLLFAAWKGQSQEEIPIRNYGNPKRLDEMFDACASRDGGILSCGTAESEDGVGKDALLMKTNYLGDLVFRKRIGLRSRNERALAVAEDPDGKIWIGGYSDSMEIYRAWLMCRGPAGNVLWERPLEGGYRTMSSVQDIELDRAGRSVAVAGIAEGRVWFGMWNLNGEKKFEPKKIEHIDGQTNLLVEKVVLVEGRDAWFLYGSAITPNNPRQIFFIKVNAQGDRMASVLLQPHDKILHTGRCVLTKGGNLLGVGTTDVSLLDEEAFTVYIQDDLDRQTSGFEFFGGEVKGKRLDIAADIIALDAQTCLVAGSTQSHQSGARVSNFAIWRVDHKGHRTDTKMKDVGRPIAEEGVRILRMPSGEVWMCGVQNDGNRMRTDMNFAFAKIMSPDLSHIAVSAEKLGFKVPETIPDLYLGGSSVLPVEMINQTGAPVEGMYVATQCDTTRGCYSAVRYLLPPLQAGEHFIANIPVWADQEATTGENEIHLTLNQANGTTLVQKRTRLTIKERPKPDIRFISAVSASSKKPQVLRGKKTFVEITLRNDGDADAVNVTVAFPEPDAARLDIGKDYSIPRWRKGETQTFQIALTANKFGDATQVLLKTFLTADNLRGAPIYQTDLQIVDQEEVVTEPEPLNPDLDFNIYWDDKNDLMNRQSLKDKFEIHARIVSNVPVSIDDLWLIHTHAGGTDSIRIKGVKNNIVAFEQDTSIHHQYSYYTSQNRTLKSGDNVLQLLVKKGNKQAVTAHMTVRYTPNESTLYVLSVGVPDETGVLEHTERDANDIARLFARQKDRLYGAIKTTVLTSKETTSGKAVAQAISKFRISQEREILKPTDAILIFISTHGFVSDQDNLFRLAGSDFSRDAEENTSLSLKSIIGKIEGLNCPVFLLLDACHSAAETGKKDANEVSQQVVDDFKNAPRGVYLIASCQSNQSSYEDDAWQNSAFVEGLETLLGSSGICSSMDADGNGSLTIKELFSRFPDEVNRLVRTVRRDETQTPFVAQEILNEPNPVSFWKY